MYICEDAAAAQTTQVLTSLTLAAMSSSSTPSIVRDVFVAYATSIARWWRTTYGSVHHTCAVWICACLLCERVFAWRPNSGMLSSSSFRTSQVYVLLYALQCYTHIRTQPHTHKCDKSERFVFGVCRRLPPNVGRSSATMHDECEDYCVSYTSYLMWFLIRVTRMCQITWLSIVVVVCALDHTFILCDRNPHTMPGGHAAIHSAWRTTWRWCNKMRFPQPARRTCVVKLFVGVFLCVLFSSVCGANCKRNMLAVTLWLAHTARQL